MSALLKTCPWRRNPQSLYLDKSLTGMASFNCYYYQPTSLSLCTLHLLHHAALYFGLAALCWLCTSTLLNGNEVQSNLI